MFEEARKGTKKEDKPEHKDEKVISDASAWNENAYHWEEKAVSSWATSRLKELINECKFEAEGTKVTIKEITNIMGDVICLDIQSSVNIRKGKKLVEYDYNITAELTGDSFEGTVNIVMDSVSGKEISIIPNITKSKDPKVDDPIKADITSKVKTALNKFIEELNAK